MVASGDSRPGRAALGSCESESWRSGDAENPAAVERYGIQDRPVVCDSNGVAVASGRAIEIEPRFCIEATSNKAHRFSFLPAYVRFIIATQGRPPDHGPRS